MEGVFPGMTDIAPHGGALVNLYLPDNRQDDFVERAVGLPTLKLNPRELSDLEMMASGAFSPLEGFMGRDDYDSVVRDMHLKSGLPWSLPITLSSSKDQTNSAKPGDDIALADASGTPVALLHLEETYPYDKELEAKLVYRTTDAAHPGVSYLLQQGGSSWAGRSPCYLQSGTGPSKDITCLLPFPAKPSPNGDGRQWLAFRPGTRSIEPTNISRSAPWR